MTPPISRGADDDVVRDFKFGEQFVTQQMIETTLALMRDATEREDYTEATDTVVPGARVARRVRRLSNCGDRRDMTIRAFRKSGEKNTEYEKLTAGKARCDAYSFAWVNTFGQMQEWALIDVATWKDRYAVNKKLKRNHDGKTGFYYWPISEIGACVIARKILPMVIPKIKKCDDCWENRSKWVLRGRRYFCRECGRFIGYVR